MSGLPFNGTAVWDSLSHLVRRERNWLYRQRHPSHSQRITTSGLVEYRGTCCPSSVAHMPRYGAAPRIRTRSITTFWDMITIISLRAYNEKDLKGKERVVPPGIEIPGIPARKLVNHDGVWLHITEGGMDGSVQQACMDSLFGGAKSEPTGEWTEMDLNGISRWQKQDDGAADIIWKSAD